MNFQEIQAFVATGAFILFIVWDIGWDIARNFIGGVSWIPGKALVLSAVTIQLVGYFDRKNVDIFGKSREQQVKQLIDDQLLIDGARLCFIVFLGYIQPQMASAAAGGRWTNIAALALSLSLHVATEIFAIQNVRKSRDEELISSSIVFLVGATCLVLYLGCTILAGKFIRDTLSRKISQILSENQPQGDKFFTSFREKISQILSENPPKGDKLCILKDKISRALLEKPLEDDRSSRLKLEMLKSWTVAFAWKAQYKLASSAFIPAVGMIVTICVVVVGNKARHLLHHGSYLGLASYLQCAFIIIGWIAILCRWFVAVYYYGSSTNRKLENVSHYTNRFRYLLFLYMRIELSPKKLIIESYLNRKPSTILWAMVALLTWTIFFIVLIPLFIFIAVIHSLFYISFFSWIFSVIFSRLSYVTGLTYMLDKMIGGQESVATTKEDKEFLECKECLKQVFHGVLIDEEVDRLWKYHLKCYNQTKPRMEEAYQEIQKCKELLKLFNVGEKERIFLKEIQNSNLPFKMVAMAIIDTMVRLLTKFEGDLKVDVEEIIKAYKEIKDLLEFVDCSENIAIDPMDMFGTCNFEALEMSLEADKHMRRIEKRIQQQSGGGAQQAPTRQQVLDFLKEEKEELEEDMKKSESKQESEFGYMNTVTTAFIVPAIAFTPSIVKRVVKFLEPVNKLLNRVEGCPGCVVKCLWYLVRSLFLACMALILFFLLVPFTMVVSLLSRNDLTEFGYYKDMALKKSRHFVYITILDSCVSELENNNNSDLGNEMIGCFRDLIHCCAQQLSELLIEQSHKWAKEFQEDKISKALEIAEKLRAVMDVKERRVHQCQKQEISVKTENVGVDDEIQIVMESE